MTKITTTLTSILILLCSSIAIAQQYTITYNLDGGTATNPATYEQADITTTVTIAVYDLLMNGSYVENGAEDLVYYTGLQCQTWSRSKLSGGENFNAATDVSFDLNNSSITWTEFGPESDQSSIDATCAAGLNGATKTVVDGEYLIQDQGVAMGQDPFYLGIRSIEFSSIILNDATKNGYTFEGWFTDAGFTNQITEIVDGTTGNLELYAKFSVTTGLLSSSNIQEFSFYPNPNTGVIHTDLEVSSLEILNAEGSVVSEFSTTEASYDVSSLKSGVYVIKATDREGALYTSKLIIE